VEEDNDVALFHWLFAWRCFASFQNAPYQPRSLRGLEAIEPPLLGSATNHPWQSAETLAARTA
jgi:hypothetical protein